ncbi:MAG: hypothetical protein AUJ71_03000 [Candidatus Omnitrophica bacterium CG1_02_49_16]|nr:MAG: hypothetical protein AUJ71_03000 [Candidatus Omnitrophica bacterium CG1_02_49_16]
MTLNSVSVVICSYNGSARIKPTLLHLAKQEVPHGVDWEVLLIDNASTDDTARIASEVWAECLGPVPLRVISEPRFGLGYARNRAFREAHGDVIVFVDDDNWLTPDWIRTAVDTLKNNPSLAACGGYNEPVFEVSPPAWFTKYESWYALGCQGRRAMTVPALWAAGAAIKKKSWLDILDQGFQTRLFDHEGDKLNTGGDTEISYSLRLAGWQLLYDPRLRLKHYIPATRLTWSYLKRLRRGYGAALVELEFYQSAFIERPLTVKERLRQYWLFQMLSLVKSFLMNAHRLILSTVLQKPEGSNLIFFELMRGRLGQLWLRKTNYHRSYAEIKNAAWRGVSPKIRNVHA